ncbi:MAG TPA: hypothetical protein VLM89_06505 [Phycisphaerae bacterium]|nr:hypothetical protein [Phycisphaerae bacterium]
MRVLVSAPYVGEVGWELMSWQGRVRHQFERGGFDRLVVLGAAGKAAFYADMAGEYRDVDLSSLPGQAYEDRRILTPDCEPVSAGAIRATIEPMVDMLVAHLRNRRDEVEVLWPDYAGTIHPCEPEHQRFVRFERPRAEIPPAPWVVLVQRTRSMGSANWSPRAWAELAEILSRRGIHTTVYSYESEAAIEAASHCDLAVGQSTGGLHLASLCGCPHVVWYPGEPCLWTPWQITNRQRYETFWNPLATPLRFHEVDRQPAPTEVADWIAQALVAIGRRTGSATAKTAFRARWFMKRWLARRVVRRDSFRRWPWPVQQLVRCRLI